MSDEKKSISLPLANPEKSVEAARPRTREEGGDVLSEIAREVADHAVVLYMKGQPEQPMCGFSARAAAILASYNKPFYAVDILVDPAKRQGIKEFSSWPTIPQVYVGGEFVGGSDILMQLHENGELAALITAAVGE
ncbi:Grx4 family monothiol glutaredoxin [Lujinxingia litoralis]|uniref:Grx4 family monothiol glutaredoxin n=1 Tax=Lujinxingia litoralis TaxID=2211119 RepID=A0A328C6M4_9DELT|nr:Grx4 family monothiol glutaredoxin [Lujinxingia litoralis]RAL22906.1 Grx4 family monothiol glutaredoxin [Lujinxingia litoralis]